MARTIQQELDHKGSLSRSYITIIEILFLYLIVDYTALRLTNAGGCLFWQNRYSSENVFARFDYWPNANPTLIELDYYRPFPRSRIMYHVPPPGAIIVLESSQMPFWAPVHIDRPAIIAIDYTTGYTHIPVDFESHAMALIEKLDGVDAYGVDALSFQTLLVDASKPKRLNFMGLIRTTMAFICAVGIVITIPRFIAVRIRIRALSRSIRLNICTCGYSLAGLTSPTCPECGRTIAATPAQSPTTLNA